MDCQKVREKVLESFDEAIPSEVRQEIERHLARCPACDCFAARQKAIDARLSAMLVTPQMTPGFRSALQQRIRRENQAVWSDVLPDIVHFMSCAVATLLCAIVLPFAPSTILAAGASAALLTYIALTGMRNLFRDVEEPDQ